MTDVAKEVLGRKPIIASQGKIVVEKAEEPEGGYMVMFPDGAVAWKQNRKAVAKAADHWFRSHLEGADVGVGIIEWR